MPYIMAPTGRRAPVSRIGCPTSRRHRSTQRDVRAGWARRDKLCAALYQETPVNFTGTISDCKLCLRRRNGFQ